MIKSDLATLVVEAHPNNYNVGRNGQKVCKITPHIMAGVLSAQRCGELFQNPSRLGSSNYGIGKDGEIACYVGEENRAWTSSSRENDYQAITIELSNSEIGGDWKISDVVWNSLVELCVDICKRYEFKLIYDGTPNGSLTRHNMFAATTCPGAYVQSRLQELANTVNSLLEGTEIPQIQTKPTKIQEKSREVDYSARELQKALNNDFGCKLVEDNDIGPISTNAISRNNIKKGSKGQFVKWVQNKLNQKGFSVGRFGVDGSFGNDTNNAVINFQKNRGLIADGIVGINTVRELLK